MSARYFALQPDWWLDIVGDLEGKVWSKKTACADLRWWQDQVLMGLEERIPPHRKLAERWGWKPKKALLLLENEEAWSDPHKAEAWRAQAGHKQGTTGAQEGHTEDTTDIGDTPQIQSKGNTEGTGGAQAGHKQGTTGAQATEIVALLPVVSVAPHTQAQAQTQTQMSVPPPLRLLEDPVTPVPAKPKRKQATKGKTPATFTAEERLFRDTWSRAWKAAGRPTGYRWSWGEDFGHVRNMAAAHDPEEHGPPTAETFTLFEKAAVLYIEAADRREAWPFGDPPLIRHFVKDIAKWLQFAEQAQAPQRPRPQYRTEPEPERIITPPPIRRNA